MKKVNAIFKLSVFILFIVLMASCNKEEEAPGRVINTPAMEAEQIAAWLDSMEVRGKDVYTLEGDSGTLLYYVKIDSIGTGALVKTGDKVTVKYTGIFLDGVPFDGSNAYTFTQRDTIADNKMIDGWYNAVELMKKGETTAFLLPSAQAYGANGTYGGVIPPYTPLIFIIEVTDIK